MVGEDPYLWFLGTAAATVAGWTLGRWLGRGSAAAGRCGIAGGLLLILAWAWLIRHPSAAVLVLSARALSRIEGIGGVPIFMFVLGIAWTRSRVPRQRHVIAWAITLGAIHLVNGGRWLLEETPSAVMGQTVSPLITRQSQDYSCVAAACATALNMLGHPSTEAQMAELTHTRAGRGATIIRAFDGLNQRLAGSSIRPQLLEPSLTELARLPLPALTPLQFESARQHMVVVTRVGPRGVWIMDPMEGYLYFGYDELGAVYRDQAIVFHHR